MTNQSCKTTEPALLMVEMLCLKNQLWRRLLRKMHRSYKIQDMLYKKCLNVS